MLVGCYDPEWQRFSPGSLLFAAWAADSLARGDMVLEFGGDHLDYKEHWATERVQSHHLRLFGRTPRGRLKSWLRPRP
jgi:CelD/BcsL family acetyltransferase involved in cellulose biosynthesis